MNGIFIWGTLPHDSAYKHHMGFKYGQRTRAPPPSPCVELEFARIQVDHLATYMQTQDYNHLHKKYNSKEMTNFKYIL